ncbi:hypothetical protein ACLOJK_035395 [Asimina triloba]
MISFQPDPDAVRWGLLNLLDGDPFTSSGYCGATNQSDANYYDGEYARECQYSTDRNNVESDEIIAYALQEELSHLAVAEASGSSQVGEEHVQASFLAQDWLGPPMGDFNSGQEGGQEDREDTEPSTSCSSPEEKSYDGEEWSYTLEIMDESSALDGEVGKRLNQMVPVPAIPASSIHVPRINGEIPSVDEATSDHQRLQDRIMIKFRALSDQFYRTTEHHKFVRQQVVNQLKSHPETYEGYVPMAYDDYLKKISTPGEWGDHVTLQAAADSTIGTSKDHGNQVAPLYH